jgi:aminomethyltransferase
MTDDMLTTSLHDTHAAAGATMIQRDGWELVQDFGDVDAEVDAARNRAAVLDSSHLGRIRVRGDGALELLEAHCSADVAHQEDDTALLTDIRNAAGETIDTGFLIRLESFWVFTSNAAAREGVLAALAESADGLGTKVDDQTFKTSMITVVGPAAADILDAFLPVKASSLPRGTVKQGSLMLARYIAARTGSTPLWSLEVTLPNMLAGQAWKFITKKAGDNPLLPIGQAAVDILRATQDA